MPVLRVVFAMLALAFVQPALAVEFWDPAQCEEYMLDHVGHLEEYVTEMGEARVLLDAAQRKGDAAAAAHLEVVIESKRVDGIISMLKRIDTVEYVYCDKSLYDPALIARVDAVRPFAEAGEAVVAGVEEPVDLLVAGVTSTFVPYETIEGRRVPRAVHRSRDHHHQPRRHLPAARRSREAGARVSRFKHALLHGQPRVRLEQRGGWRPAGDHRRQEHAERGHAAQGWRDRPASPRAGRQQPDGGDGQADDHGGLVPPDRGRQQARDRARAVQLRCPDLGCVHPVRHASRPAPISRTSASSKG